MRQKVDKMIQSKSFFVMSQARPLDILVSLQGDAKEFFLICDFCGKIHIPSQKVTFGKKSQPKITVKPEMKP